MRVWPLLLLSLAAAMPAARALDDCQADPEAAQRALNALRARGHACGDRSWPAARALRWHVALGEASRRYATELATLDRLDHIGVNGATLRTRLHEAGYVMRASGENLAGGPETFDEALAQWLASPTHCENLMAAEFEDFGLACVSSRGKLQRYWVLQLAAPVRSSPGR